MLRRVALIASVTVLAACGGGSSSTSSTSQSSTAASPAGSAKSSPAAGFRAAMHVVLKGGPVAGTWDVKSDRQDACSYLKDTNKNQTAWTAVYSAQGNNGLVYFSLATMDTSNPRTHFTAQAEAKDSNNDALYVMSTLQGAESVGGQGTMTVDDNGATAKMGVDATTKEGWSIAATIDCQQVYRVGA